MSVDDCQSGIRATQPVYLAFFSKNQDHVTQRCVESRYAEESTGYSNLYGKMKAPVFKLFLSSQPQDF